MYFDVGLSTTVRDSIGQNCHLVLYPDNQDDPALTSHADCMVRIALDYGTQRPGAQRFQFLTASATYAKAKQAIGSLSRDYPKLPDPDSAIALEHIVSKLRKSEVPLVQMLC